MKHELHGLEAIINFLMKKKGGAHMDFYIV